MLVGNLHEKYFIEQRTLKFVQKRLQMLFNTLMISDISQYSALNLVASFATMLSTYYKGFTVLIEPFPPGSTVPNPVLQLYCHDASLCLRPIINKFKNVLLTGNQMQPINTLAKVLGISPRMHSFQLSLPKNRFGPYIMTKGADQLEVCSKHDQRENTGVVRNFGSLLFEMSTIVPDGILCFFPSFKYMEYVLLKWNEAGILQRILDNKLLFIETADAH